jgi:two-component system cell cycle sensor histidine kinase/response regulator CckA
MNDEKKTKKQLVHDLEALRERIAELEIITEQAGFPDHLGKKKDDYRLLFEEAVIGLFQSSPEGEVISVNPAFAWMFGYESPVEFITSIKNMATDIFVDPRRRTEIMRLMKDNPDHRTFENVYRRKDGSTFIGRLHVWFVNDARGRLLRLEGCIEDINDYKRAEETLHKSEELYRQLAETSHDLIMTVDLNSKITYVNKASLHFSEGIDPIGMSIKDLATPHLRQRQEEMMQKRREGFSDMLAFEWEIIHPNGKITTFDTRSTLLTEAGKPAGVMFVARDMTARKRAEEALRESEEKYRILLDESTDPIFSFAPDGRYLYVNRAFARGVGKEQDQIIGNKIWDVFSREEADKRFSSLSLVFQSGQEKIIEVRVPRPDGDRYYITTITPIKDEQGKVISAICSSKDITDRKLAEDERNRLQERLQRVDKMEALGTLAGGVAHDLNNVLGVLVGYSELLLHSMSADSPLRNHVEKLMNGGVRAAAIVQDLLTLARRGVRSESVVQLNSIIADFQKTPEFENLCSSHRLISIKTNLAVDLLNIKGSPSHISKTFMNLLTNAVEAMPEGGRLTVTTENKHLDRPVHGYDKVEEGDYVLMSVSDTGEGISDLDINHIFEPFYTKKIMGRSGTGLGLAVVWGTVKDHKGYIDVRSKQGQGTTLTLYFPVTREDFTPSPSAISLSEYTGNDESILVVDDITEQRELAAMILGRLNYKVSTVASGEEAVEYLKSHRVDLIILDMIMDPGMDGLDTYKRILDIRPDQKAIIVSGYSSTERVREAQSLGAGAYVKKPYVSEKLGLAVRKELDK